MGTNDVVFLEVIEWFDETGKELVHRMREKGSGEIKFGGQLIVRKSQAAVLFYKRKARETFGPGGPTLKTGNIPFPSRYRPSNMSCTSILPRSPQCLLYEASVPLV
jgi:membrane protease subunit (stomatin/prohibitin family)